MEPPSRIVISLNEQRLAAEVREVVRRFPVEGDVVTALDHVDLDIPVGKMTIVAGPSGSGKSTLLSLLACMQRADEGVVMVGDTDVMTLGRRDRRELRRDRLGIVLPQPSENLLDQLDAGGNVRWAADQRRDRDSTVTSEDLDALLDSVGLAAASTRRVRELSGGEQQRLAVACALAGGPELVILDEPTASLDRVNAQVLVDVLAGVASRGATMVIATHDPMVIEAGAVIAELDHGRRIR
ncbi:MAG TPA: ATP-binding cassette domain-containing protein [Ilumatobacteraceae bacterium]|nr:ATP-binding cassette domain-containing protein [Ilumatobacteraceae bacterium]